MQRRGHPPETPRKRAGREPGGTKAAEAAAMARLKGGDSCAEVLHESLLRETVTRFLG